MDALRHPDANVAIQAVRKVAALLATGETTPDALRSSEQFVAMRELLENWGTDYVLREELIHLWESLETAPGMLDLAP